ncbi:hypothetical protein GQ42DRAFT_166446 [Ramicandelaber brevisporus]|nr:hypothetical protein GQ42DRAFT_166446 [Ramicandelaber brevisporus]
MPLIPPVKTQVSSSLAHSRQRTIQLYRDWLKSLPSITRFYQLSLPQVVLRSKVREEFEKNRYETNLKVIDIMLFKGELELRETVNVWKQTSHLMNYFARDEADPKPQTFLEKFYAGQN